MPRWLALLTCLSLVGCAYVTKEEFDSFWDADEDGWPLGNDQNSDCDPNNKDIFPFAPDIRGDGCDADCGREADDDGDDWPNSADCDSEDPEVFPCSPFEVDGDGIDHDCDGNDSARDPDDPLAPCNDADPDFEDARAIPADECGNPAPGFVEFDE